MIQITDDPRFYPQPLSEKQKYRLQKLDAVIEGVPGNGNKCLYPQGRTLENFDDSWWNTIAPKCVNVRLLAKQGVDSIRGIVNTLFRAGKVCTPSISPAGEIKLGESALCPSVASIYDTEQEIIEKIQRCRCQSCEYSWQQLKSTSIKAFEMLEKIDRNGKIPVSSEFFLFRIGTFPERKCYHCSQLLGYRITEHAEMYGSVTYSTRKGMLTRLSATELTASML